MSSPDHHARLQFSARLRHALSRPSRGLELVNQVRASDCGIACLTMALACLGRREPTTRIRDAVGTIGPTGLSLAQLAEAAAHFGARARGYQLELDELGELAPGAILHWDLNHFVVLGGRRRRRGRIQLEILDPARGRRWLESAEVGRHFTGVALELETSERFVPSEARERPLAPYFRRVLAARRSLAAAVVASMSLQLLGFAVPAAFALAVEELIPWGEVRALELLGLALVLAALAQAWTQLIRGRILAQLDVELESDMRGEFMFHLMHLPQRFHTTISTGDLLQRANSHGRIRDAIAGLALSAALDACTAVVFFAALLWLVPSVALVVALLAAFQALTLRLTRGLREQMMAEVLTSDAACQATQVELLHANYSIKAMGREAAMLQRWSAQFVTSLRQTRRRANFQAGLYSLSSLVFVLVPAAVVCFAGAAVMRGEIGVGALFAVSTLAPAFINPMTSLVMAIEGLADARSVARRANEVLESTSELAHARELHELRGEIELRELEFGYDPQQPLFTGLNLHIAAGTMVAIVGATGSGKSTLAKLVLGFETPTSGQVLIDGRPLETLDPIHLRRQIGVVPQRVELITGSLHSNICFGHEASPEQVERAATSAAIHARICAEPSGYETPVAEGGSSLSGGEGQRLALARALVHEPKLLILDEATSALDTATEGEVHRKLAALSCTKLVIAHRLSTIRHADQIVVLDRGRVAEQGTHDELLTRAGLYAKFVDEQLGEPERPLSLAPTNTGDAA